MRVVILGAGGLLGSAFSSALREHDVLTLGRTVLDVRNPSSIPASIGDFQPDVVVNCAADTNVDRAETAPDQAFAANAILPGLVATACRRIGIPLIHFSSTGCYGNWKQDAYVESDELQPTTVHHKSKLAGERAITGSGCEFLILRTGWLFGGEPQQPKNFVWNRLMEARGKDRLVSDPFQRGNPTFVNDVVRQSLLLYEAKLSGIFNCVSTSGASRFDYVSRIVETSGLNCRVDPASAPFTRPAPVSANEVARNFYLDLIGLNHMVPWTQAVDEYVRQLMTTPAWLELQ